MAIQTIKATIQMRYGLEADLKPDQLVTGEWAVATDKKKIWMCFRPGLVLRMATYEAFEQDMREIQLILATCQDIQAAVERFEQLAEQHASQAETWSATSKSWAVGGTGTREGEDTDNSKYYSEQSKNEADRAKEEADRAASIVGLDIDSELSETSTNPVQNKIITREFDKKLVNDGDASNVTAIFSQAENRTNIANGEKLSTMLGKIQKFFGDMKTVAFTGKYSDLEGRLTLTNNYLATQPGTAGDAMLSKRLRDDLNTIIDNINYSRFRIDNSTLTVEEGTESVLPIKTVITNADTDNYEVNENGTININKAGIYLVIAKAHGSFRTDVAGYVRVYMAGMYYSNYISNGGSNSIQFQECVPGAFYVTGKTLLKLTIYSMVGQINIYPSSVSPYTEVVIVRIK